MTIRSPLPSADTVSSRWLVSGAWSFVRNVQLIVARIPGIYTGGGSGFGVAVCDMLCLI